MHRKPTDFRALRARRELALARYELRRDPKPAPLDPALIEAAIKAGRFTRLATGKERRR